MHDTTDSAQPASGATPHDVVDAVARAMHASDLAAGYVAHDWGEYPDSTADYMRLAEIAVNTVSNHRTDTRRRIDDHNRRLTEALDARFEDGTSVVEYILLTNPDLAARLRHVLQER